MDICAALGTGMGVVSLAPALVFALMLGKDMSFDLSKSVSTRTGLGVSNSSSW